MKGDVPAGALQMRGGDERITAVVSLAGKNETATGYRKELSNYLRNAGASFIHESFRGDSSGERGLLCFAHFRRTNDGRVHWLLLSEVSVFFFVVVFFLVEDFFFLVR